MTTKREILLQAGRELGDTSDNFIVDILAPALDFVLRDLTAFECVEAVRTTAMFRFREGVTDYETREICHLTSHYPADIVSLTVWPWGLNWGQIKKAENNDEFERARLQDWDPETGASLAQLGRVTLWRLYPNHHNLQVHPAVDSTHADECEILFIRPWQAIELDEDVLDLQEEDIDCAMLGVKCRGQYFAEQLQADRQLTEMKYQAAKKRMWARRWVRPGRSPYR
jgi:hypothetical protein